ncbi:MAG: 2-iminoacetate synthase ThiH [Anaeromicrobium sp.]|jgi:2-iminoacetate synthase|uniref:2-iminoacetate synthase ThiH n=1 Tax=Anaeromicrobium sp. TaxID=1929132 RepID=UPI0025F27348|nr:2-iminoacetate synthase ThiH [Anaeromicrobium sp.]MCT4595682.1 2-iminoacetate synthase ThiH [Anaeromicrobium sp.]
MGFYDEYLKFKGFNYEEFFNKITEEHIISILKKDKINIYDYLALLSPLGEKFIEEMAKKAHSLSLSHFGKTILLFTPMYISNKCINECVYCGYNVHNFIKRKKLSLDEVEAEAKAIADKGLKHILLLTGESPKATPVSYIIEVVNILKKYFDSIGIEIYPLNEDEYKEVVEAGVDSLTVYQEVYDEDIYDNVHISGPKKDYIYRLDAPERGCKANMRTVNIGALLGLNEWRREGFITGLHANYLQNKYPHVSINVSPPRIRPHVGVFENVYEVSDKNIVQNILALKIFLPYVGITISTREEATLRDNLIPLGVTKMSAGVSTQVGGHSVSNKGEAQFEIADLRSVEEMRKSILQKGYQPVFKDWMCI